jgi:2-hydroxychromene-2-carboxylate isomerase
MPNPVVDFWFDFGSTYSYPAAMRIAEIASEADVRVRWRPFLLGPIFQAQGLATSPFNLNPAKGRYMWRDLERLCADLGLPFRRPELFPQDSLTAARVALAGLGESWGEDFCRGVFHAEFAEGRRIDDEAVLTGLLAGMGLEPERILAAARTDAIRTGLRTETAKAQALGVFGAPSFTTTDGELFWGSDRLEQALRWARKTRE